MRKNSWLTRQELFSVELPGVGLGGRPESQLREPGSEGTLFELECRAEVQLLRCEVSLGEDIDKRPGDWSVCLLHCSRAAPR